MVINISQISKGVLSHEQLELALLLKGVGRLPCGSPVSEAVVASVPTSDCTLLDEVDCVLGEVLESGLKATKKSSQSFSSSST